MMIYQNIRYKKKTAEDIIAMVNVLRDDVKSFEESHNNIDFKVTAMTNEFNRKFDILFGMLNMKSPLNHANNGGAIPGSPKARTMNSNKNNPGSPTSDVSLSPPRIRERRTGSF